MCLFGSFGNAIAWWYMFLRKNEKKTTKKESHIKGLYILSSLLVADTIVCCVSLPIQAVRMFNFDLLVSCAYEAVTFYVNFVTVWASSLSICVIAFERFVQITRFKQYNNIITFSRIRIILTVCWLVALVGPAVKFICGPKIFAPMNGSMLAFPVLVIPFFYYHIVKTVKTSERKLLQSVLAAGCSTRNNQHSFHHTPRHISKSNVSTLHQKTICCKQAKKVSRKCSLLIINFFFCSITCFILMVIVSINTRKKFMKMYTVHLMTRFAFTGLTMNSCMNPVIYVMRDSKFKAALRQSFFGKRQNRVTPIQNVNPFDSAEETFTAK